jgi:hypothetical protein
MRTIALVGLLVSLATAALAQDQVPAPLGDQSQANTPPAATTAPATTPLAPPAVIPPSAPPPAASAPAANGFQAATDDTGDHDCKPVTITRPNVTASPVAIRILNPKNPNDDVTSLIANCNKSNPKVKVVPSPSGHGTRVIMPMTVGAVGTATISLPISIADWLMDQVVCLPPAIQGGAPGDQKYAARWHGQLQDAIAMSAVDMSALLSEDRARMDAGCLALSQRQANK